MRVVIPSTYNGPPGSANGGYACGVFSRLAKPSDETVPAVVLHTPPPLATTLDVRPLTKRVQVWCGARLVATVGAGPSNMPDIEPVTVDEARRAESSFGGKKGHPFPTCFVCGVEREPAAGFPLAPGRVGEHDLVACTWTPTTVGGDNVPTELVWSALDCPGGWTGDPIREPMVLGRMSTIVYKRPEPGNTYVVVGRLWRRQGRTAKVGTALYDNLGRLLAKAASVWVAVNSTTAKRT